jgi:Protein of unknown function (DUF3300)
MNPLTSKAIISKSVIASLALFMTGFASFSTSVQAQQVSINLGASQDDSATYSASDLDGLLAPIALYPDPLLAQVLVAATFDDQIQDAAQVISADGGAAAIDQQSWDESVKAVAHYPRVLFALSAQPDWTSALGQAYVSQPDDVMTAVQRLRAEAYTQGNLVTSQQQQVVAVGGMIQILPVRAGYIYLPSYDPTVVFSASAYISFGPAFAIDSHWDGQIDWHARHVVDRHHHVVRTGGRDRIGRARRAHDWARRREGGRRGSSFAHNHAPTRNPGFNHAKNGFGGKGGNGGFGGKAGNGGKGGSCASSCGSSTSKTLTSGKGGNGGSSLNAKGGNGNKGANGKNTTLAKASAPKSGKTAAANRGQSNRSQTNRAQVKRAQSTRPQTNRAQANRGFSQPNRESYNTAMNHGGGMARSAGRSHR